MSVRHSGLQKEILALYRRCVIFGLGFLPMVGDLAVRCGWSGQSPHRREIIFAYSFATISRRKQRQGLPGI